jgi:hypothetical protein
MLALREHERYDYSGYSMAIAVESQIGAAGAAPERDNVQARA